jgi:hypothetical protein
MATRFERLIAETRDRFGDPPRAFGFLQRWHLRLKRPSWWKQAGEEISAIYRDQRFLMNLGQIAWGVMVQANNLLFEPGADDCPGVVIYSPDRKRTDSLTPLLDMASALGDLKESEPSDPYEQRYGRMLAGELEGGRGQRIPKSISRGVDVFSTAVMFHRKHLPTGLLSQGHFPVLFHPSTKAVIVVPSRYWSPDLIRDWKDKRARWP